MTADNGHLPARVAGSLRSEEVMKKVSSVLPLLCFIVLFVALSIPFLNYPVDTWEWLNHAAARQVAQQGIPATDAAITPESILLIHPPSWPYVAGISVKIWGDTTWPMRAAGVLVVLLSAMGLLCLYRALKLPKEGEWFLVAVYLTNPAVLQGALYISFSEGTLLPLSFVVTAWTWTQLWPHVSSIRSVFLLGLCLASALWAKITTSLALPLCAGLALLVQTSECPSFNMSVAIRKVIKSIGGAFGIALTGGAVFCITWCAYTYAMSDMTHISFSTLATMPFRYMASEGSLSHTDFISLSFVQSAGMALARFVLYAGPFLCFLGFWAMANRVKRFGLTRVSQPHDFYYGMTCVVTLIYLALPGGTGSFPKYHLAVLPFLCLMATEIILARVPASDKAIPWFVWGGIAIAGILYYRFIVGDYLYLFNRVLRFAVYTGADVRSTGLLLVVKCLLYASFPFLAGFALQASYRQKALWRAIVFISVLSAQVGMTLAQISGEYFVIHSYGSPVRDLVALTATLERETQPGDSILSLPEITYLAERHPLDGMTRSYWNRPEILAKLIVEKKPEAIVYSFTTHTVHQMKDVFANPQFLSALKENYTLDQIGDYTLWKGKHQESP